MSHSYALRERGTATTTTRTKPRGRIRLPPHAQKAMKDDDLYKIDVENMLRRCSVANVEDSEGEESWRGYGSDGDGRKFFAIIVPYECDPSIKVITVFVEKAKK